MLDSLLGQHHLVLFAFSLTVSQMSSPGSCIAALSLSQEPVKGGICDYHDELSDLTSNRGSAGCATYAHPHSPLEATVML